MLQVREHLEGDRQLGLDVTIIGVCYGARVLVVLVEGPAPQVMDSETEDYHLEGISLLAASLAPGVKHVAKIVEVAQVCLGSAHGLEILKRVAELFTNSLNIVTLFKSACVVTGGLASQDVKG